MILLKVSLSLNAFKINFTIMFQTIYLIFDSDDLDNVYRVTGQILCEPVQTFLECPSQAFDLLGGRAQRK